MTKEQAILAIIARFGGLPSGLLTFKFDVTDDVDEFKAVLDALFPGLSGAVFGFNRLCVDTTDDAVAWSQKQSANA